MIHITHHRFKQKMHLFTKSQFKLKSSSSTSLLSLPASSLAMRALLSTTSIMLPLLLVIISWPGYVNSVRAPATVFVNKCCRIGEQLDRNQQCLVGGTEQWWPLIYLVLKQTYYAPRGEAPRFIKPREQIQPVCDSPELLTGTDSMALFSNGSLFLLQRNAFVDADNYCIDKDIAIVCFPRPQGVDSLRAPVKLANIKKCCGTTTVYSTIEKTCVPLDEGHEVLSKNLVANSSMIDFIYGFPECSVNNHYTIAGEFKEANLNIESGDLTLESGHQFKWSEYCLEHTINDIDAPYVNVFTCAEHFSVPESVAVPKDQQVRTQKIEKGYFMRSYKLKTDDLEPH